MAKFIKCEEHGWKGVEKGANMTKREKHLLWMILNKTIGRYILVNMPGYGSGERADLHLYISKILCHYILMDGGLWTIRGLEDEYPKGTFDVHDWIANNITDRMDETIGFVVDRQMTHEEQGICTRKFFELLCANIDEIAKVVIRSKRDSVGLYNG